jgi:hypothetical protein
VTLCAIRPSSRCSTPRRKRPIVTPLGPGLALALAILGASYGFAEDRAPAAGDSGIAPNAIDSLTGKERLGKKWMDEQRIDNCKVPADKQGARPRSGACPHVPTG